jgi:hypothetical protein
MPLLEGLDGVQKMSKSLGNYIGIDEPAIDIVTKTMKIGDALMWRWIELLSFEIGVDEAKTLQADVAGGRLNPRDIKLRLARELAARFHGAAAADNAVVGWNAAVRGEGDTASLPLTDVTVPAEGLRIAALLVAAGLMPSNSEANRKLKERAVRIDNVVVEDPQQVFMPGFEGVLAVGKRNFARVRLLVGLGGWGPAPTSGDLQRRLHHQPYHHAEAAEPHQAAKRVHAGDVEHAVQHAQQHECDRQHRDACRVDPGELRHQHARRERRECLVGIHLRGIGAVAARVVLLRLPGARFAVVVTLAAGLGDGDPDVGQESSDQHAPVSNRHVFPQVSS